MTVSSTTSRKTFTGNGSTTSFATSPMVFFDSADLTVYVVTTATGASTTLVENTDYTVTGGSGSTGTVSLAGGSDPYGAPASTQTLVIVREVAATQGSDLVNNDNSDAEVLEDALDRLTMGWQQVAEQSSRALRLADSDITGISVELPTPEASGFLRVNSGGTAFEYVDFDPESEADSFIQSGSGAVSRTWTAKVSESVSVKDFGALGNGTTNDTAAFELALASGAKDIYVPDGTYLVEPVTTRTDPVLGESVRCALMMRSNQRLRLSSNATIKQTTWLGASTANDDSGWMIMTLGVDNVVIEGGTLQGNWLIGGSYPSRAAGTQHGIHVASSTNVTIKDVTAKGFWGDGITISYYGNQANCDNSKNVELLNCYCKNNRRNGMSAVGLDGGAIIGGKYTATLGTSPFAGIDLEPNNVTSIASGQSRVRGVRIVGVETNGNEYGIVFTCSVADLCTNNTISGCVVNDGIVLEKANYCTVSGNAVRQLNDDPDTSVAMSGIRLIDADLNNVSGNSVYDCRRHGVEIDASSNHNNVTGNHIVACSQHTTNTYSGIYVAGDFNHVAANKIHKGLGGAVNKYGIELVAGALSNHIFANDLDTAGQTANLIDGSGSTIGMHYDNSVGAVIFGADTDIKWGKALVAMGGGAAPTVGTIGGSGPATAGQNSWLRVVDSTGAACWVPAWK